MTKTSKMDHETLKSLLAYDAESGIFIWLVSQGTRVKGSRAGTTHRDDGYCYIALNRVKYRATRLAWLYVHGRWPKEHIDHINGNTSDDRLVNLREATRSQNLGNRKLNKNNASGLKGVSKYKSRYMANINKDGVRYYLGLFDSPEEAHSVYCAKAKEFFGEFARAA